jgi:hypothetical protein
VPKRSNEFQTLVYHVYVHLAATSDRVTESAMLQERDDGPKREVDVLIEHRAAGTSLQIAVECRARKDKDDIEWIDGLIGKFKDLKVNKTIAVSQSGFTAAAQQKAKDNGIDALALERATEESWPSELICPAIGGWC